jgi:hypothetical protein
VGKDFVYVISGDHGRQKIGVSNDPRQRIAQLQTGSPFPLKFEFVGLTDGNGYEIEVEAHFLLNRHKATGGDEWFMVPPEVAITAVMAAARQRGCSIRPVDPDNIPATEAFAIGDPPWYKWVRVLFGVPAFAVMIPALLAFDRGEVGFFYILAVTLFAIGFIKLGAFLAIRAINELRAFGAWIYGR